MSLSWSHRLFFRINQSLGAHPRRDRLMLWWAEYGIFLLACLWLAFVVWQVKPGSIEFFLDSSFIVGLSALLLSYFIGWCWPHRRPLAEFPHIKELFTPLSHWKSFPSDHALVAFILAEMVWYIPTEGSIPLLLKVSLLLLATIIAIARVYTGVHYPRDIIGGFGIATILVILTGRFL